MDDRASRIANIERQARINALEAKRVAASANNAAKPPTHEFSDREEQLMSLGGYGMADKFFDEATFGFLPKAVAAGQAALGVGSEGFGYDGDFSDRYDSNLAVERERKRRYEEDAPVRSGIASGAGMLYGGGGLMRAGLTTSKLAAKAPKMLKSAASIASAGADAAAYGALHAVGNDKDVSDAASASGAIGAGLSAIPVVGRGIANTATARNIGKALVNKAGEFTPIHLAAKGTQLGNFFRNVVGRSFFGHPIIRGQTDDVIKRETNKYAEDAVNQVAKNAGGFNKMVRKLYKEALPKGAEPLTAFKDGNHTINQLASRIKEGYQRVWDGAKPISRKTLEDLDDLMQSEGLSANALNDFKALAKKIHEHAVGPEPSKLIGSNALLAKPTGASDDAARLIDREIKRYSGKFDTFTDNEVVKALTNRVRQNMTDAGKAAVKDLDSKYASYLILKDASKKALTNNGTFNAKELVSSIKSNGKNYDAGAEPLARTGRALDKATKMGDEALKTLEKTHKAKISGITEASPAKSIGTAEKMVNTGFLGSPAALLGVPGLAATLPAGATAGRLLSTPTGQKLVAGQLRGQKLGRVALRKWDRSPIAKMLRESGRATARTAGNAIEE